MSQTPPVDQRIVDEYFQLASHRKTKDVAWLYGMVATYGLKPDELIGFQWSTDNSLHIPGKKRTVRPLHPQWVLLFGLKEKQPCDLQSCWDPISLSLYRSIAYQEVRLNVTDLLLAYRIRKNYSRSFKKQKQASPSFAGAF
jgi:hypothetical protein